MKILVKVKPNAKEERVTKSNSPKEATNTLFPGTDGSRGKPTHLKLSVWVKEPPVDGKANAAVVKALAKYFKVPASEVRIVSGQTSRNKVIEVNL